MRQLFVILTLGVLVSSGSAVASIGRSQSFEIGAVNRIQWAGGIGSARSDGQVSFVQTQQSSDRSSGLSITQAGRGSLTQTASAGGTGYATARQTGDIKGSQDILAQATRQLNGRSAQDLAVRLDMRLFKPNGVGAVSGTQSYSGLQEQSLATSASTSSQSQSVDIRQSGSIGTEIEVDPIVQNTVNVNLRQSQTANAQ
jgi:hypothetical protein